MYVYTIGCLHSLQMTMDMAWHGMASPLSHSSVHPHVVSYTFGDTCTTEQLHVVRDDVSMYRRNFYPKWTLCYLLIVLSIHTQHVLTNSSP